MSLLTKDEKFAPYRIGFVSMSVCAAKELTREEVEALANVHNHAGTSEGWQISKAPAFSGGEPNPCPCNDDPANRVHYLMEC